MAFALAALVLSSVLLLLHTTSVTLAQPTPIPTTLSSMPSTSTFRRPPIVNPDPTPEQRTALFRVYDKLRCGADQCVRIGDVEAICGWDASAVCNNSVVVELFIYTTRGLEGTLGSELLSLSHLTGITVSGASLTGTISSYIGALSNLTFLDLRTNSFTGTIPTQLAQLSKLEYLDLSFNQLEGTVPDWLRAAHQAHFSRCLVTTSSLATYRRSRLFASVCSPPSPDVASPRTATALTTVTTRLICCENSLWPCGERDRSCPTVTSNVALIVGVMLGTCSPSPWSLSSSSSCASRTPANSGQTKDRGPHQQQRLRRRLRDGRQRPAAVAAAHAAGQRKYSNPLDNADSPYNVMPGQSSLRAWTPANKRTCPGARCRQWRGQCRRRQPARMHTFGDARHRVSQPAQNHRWQQSIPMPGSSGGLAQPYVPHPFIDQQHHQYNDDRFTNAQSPW
jgi:hypothetical protein